MTASAVRYVGKHQHFLPSGRPIDFGAEITVGDDIAATDDTDAVTYDVTPDEAQRLIDAGVAVALEPEHTATADTSKRPARRATKD